MWKVQTVLQHLTSHIWLHEKQVTHEDKMNSVVTYNNIRLKCYINLFTLFIQLHNESGWLSNGSESYRQILDNIVDLKKDGVA